MRKCQVVEGNRDLKVILPEVFFLDFKGSLEEVLLLARVAQLSVGAAQVAQRNRELKVLLPAVFFLYLESSFEDVLLLPRVAQVSVSVPRLTNVIATSSDPPRSVVRLS